MSERTPAFVIYAGGLWEIVEFNRSPDEDLRCGWMELTPREPSTYRLRHHFGPIPNRLLVKREHDYIEVDKVERGSFELATEMEVLAYASL